MRISRFLILATALLAALHVYIGLRLLPALPLDAGGRTAAAVVLLLSCLLIPMAVASRMVARQSLADIMAWAGSLAMGVFSSLLVLTLLRDLILALCALLAPDAYARLRGISALAVPFAALFVSLVGFVNARLRAQVVKVDVPISGLPAALDGFTIAQISDIHVGPTIKRGYLQAIVGAVNALDADLIAVTGDLVDGSVEQLANETAPLAQLTARHGVYFVTGNHEYYSDAAAWTAEIRRLGLTVLQNEHVLVRHGKALLVVAGVNDYGARQFDPAWHSDPHAALAGAPAADLKLLLAHQPRSAVEAARAGFDLQLSGHTHGGQFWPWNLFVRLQQPFTAGLHRMDALWVYTSRGTGYWGPPKRFGAPSEITQLRLVAVD
ncbi:metallophosphoesterase [Paludibacterium yongneupense]|uniref:metallophosphoesterase n=1 Tax=Paludibacterium yongneupense TaxID=400061 RepID=UPI0004160734|nr:metallophosphoesterase [Paludibacterium yongneupense]